MEGVQKFFRDVSKDVKSGISNSSVSENLHNFNSKEGLAAALSYSDQSRVLVTRPSRQLVSLWTCSKLCTVFFIAGVLVGYTLKRRVRRWASKLLKTLRDD
ncbi:uncharacterized protein LOC8259059 [Ricinus communis]|uniref:Transmembrane protein n=1 Tax=Ricinus communis TaxID=3988 RepID=B9RR54_RICCO|nr:uncharacterized protein LOC8259059 [Ricinus communis]EEF46225.1 conserved hypothetical protein [Ricinus communis]|eukprot:XP_002516223.1 uncharacterized protein LOC8259059 [Ricinus communis]